MSLRTRIAAVAGVAVALTVVAAAFILYFAVRSNLRGEVESSLTERVEPLESAARFGGPPGGGAGTGRPGRPGRAGATRLRWAGR